MIPEAKKVSYSQFLELQKGDDRLEYINGEIFLLSSPSVEHQRILLNIASILNTFFKGKKCEPFIAPFDLLLKKEEEIAPHHVQPDIMVICDPSGLKENQYIGVPELIIEVVSPSNTAHDRITKFNLYMNYGVKEYWLVNPKFQIVEVNQLTKTGLYEQVGVFKGNDVVSSWFFEELSIGLKDIF